MKRILILIAINLFLCFIVSAFQGGGGEATKKKADTKKKNSGTKSTTPPPRPPAPPARPKTPTVTSLIVNSNVPNVTVTINGRTAGTTDSNGYLLLESLKPGIYNVTITKPGYQPDKAVLNLSGGQSETLNFELKPITQSLNISSTPPECEIYIDEILRGRTDPSGNARLANVPVGEHQVAIRKSRYREAIFPLSLSSDKEGQINANLELAIGFLTVRTTPLNAGIDISGIGHFTNPVNKVECQPGTYTITIASSLYVTSKKEVRVSAAQETQLSVDLEIDSAACSRLASEALEAYSSKQYDRAITLTKTLLSVDANHPQANWLIGQSYFKIQRYNECMAYLVKAISLGEEVVVDMKYNSAIPGYLYLASGKVRVSKAGVDFDFTYGLDDFGVTPDKILDVVSEPQQNARIHIKAAVKNKKGDKESTRDFYFYSPGAVAVGTGPGGAGGSIACSACDDSMSVLYALLQKIRNSMTMPAAPQVISAQPTETKIRAGNIGPPSLTVDLGNGVKMEFVQVKAGSFQMGGDKYYEGQPVHSVTISKPFYLGKYEVTQAQWQAVMGSNPSKFKDCGGNCPVEPVSWNDAQEFIKRLNAREDGQTYQLPTEAEWEYAARAGTSGAYAGNLDAMAWYGNNSGNSKLDVDKIDSNNYHKRLADNGNRTHPVGTKQPNGWGLYDMHGNVWEWCQDWFADYSGIPAIDPSGPARGEKRVARGGAYSGTATNARLAYRFRWPPNLSGYPFGLRVKVVVRTP
jgi:formylglycine-generating enzyme required for sulfatase activity/tetratricopeptide (TPR) repeat protein